MMAPVVSSEAQKVEHRCVKCGRLLGKELPEAKGGRLEIQCPRARCKHINLIELQGESKHG